MEGIIRTVMPEFGAKGPGFAINDPEVSAMSTSYGRPRSAYFVVEDDGVVVGGGGVAPLEGADGTVAELRKMYFLPQARGRGAGKALLTLCIETARAFGFHTLYLETLTGMDDAQRLYRAFGFLPLAGPMGSTGHFSCDRYFALPLAPSRP